MAGGVAALALAAPDGAEPEPPEVTIRARRQARVGRYVRFEVRAGRPPARRRDACVVPGCSRPVAWPAV
jgi:hypothetical protein